MEKVLNNYFGYDIFSLTENECEQTGLMYPCFAAYMSGCSSLFAEEYTDVDFYYVKQWCRLNCLTHN